MSTNKKFRIQNGVDVSNGDISINDVTVIGADGKVVPAAIADAVAGLTASDIADLQTQVSAILGTSPETLDTLQEIVAAFESADSTLTGSVAQNAADIATINTTLTNGVATPTDVADLQSQVTANDTDIAANAAAIAAANARTSGISTSSGSSNIEMAADVDMGGNAISNMADPSSAQDAATKAYVDALDFAIPTDISGLQAQITSNDGDISSLQTALAAETTAREAADLLMADDISGEATNRQAADAALQSDIDDEVAARIAAVDAEAQQRNAADSSLQNQINSIVSNTDPAALDSLTEIVAAFQAADGSITGVVNSNTSRISALESGVTAIEAWDTDNVSEGSNNLYFTEARAKACVGADAGSCLDYNQASGKFSLDLSETAGALVPDNSTNADKLDGQHGSHYRIDVYDVNGNIVN